MYHLFGALQSECCIIKSKKDVIPTNKIRIYHYKTPFESFHNVIEASRLMLVNNYHIMNTNVKLKEWDFLTYTELSNLVKIWNKDPELENIIKTIKLYND